MPGRITPTPPKGTTIGMIGHHGREEALEHARILSASHLRKAKAQQKPPEASIRVRCGTEPTQPRTKQRAREHKSRDPIQDRGQAPDQADQTPHQPRVTPKGGQEGDGEQQPSRTSHPNRYLNEARCRAHPRNACARAQAKPGPTPERATCEVATHQPAASSRTSDQPATPSHPPVKGEARKEADRRQCRASQTPHQPRVTPEGGQEGDGEMQAWDPLSRNLMRRGAQRAEEALLVRV